MDLFFVVELFWKYLKIKEFLINIFKLIYILIIVILFLFILYNILYFII